MMEMVEMMFAEMAGALGYEAWYECEEDWEAMAEIMIQSGMDEEEVTTFFSEMAWEL